MEQIVVKAVIFDKLSGAGNDFICVDNRNGHFEWLLSSGEIRQFARILCQRRFSVGADGIIFANRIPNNQNVHFEARFFEPDGSEVHLCGNGVACFVYWVVLNGWIKDSAVEIATPAGTVSGEHNGGDLVKVCIPLPRDFRFDLEFMVEGKPCKCDFIITGVPHAVIYVNGTDEIDVIHLGRQIRNHEFFKPQGVNVNFVQVLREGEIALRTFEFGVENETLACGTGAASSAILSAMRYKWHKRYLSGEEPILVKVRSGDTLRVWFIVDNEGRVADVCLETVVRFIYRGTLHQQVIDGLSSLNKP
ncbi:MAG TPA: diaminopimelate epimerase [Candidatus Omnitrophica bacterium]|nr:diaminopimelate epimerase [Candidatus Omnitrophota bacterium]